MVKAHVLFLISYLQNIETIWKYTHHNAKIHTDTYTQTKWGPRASTHLYCG